MSHPCAPPTVNGQKTGHTFLWQIAGHALIAHGLILVWGTSVRPGRNHRPAELFGW